MKQLTKFKEWFFKGRIEKDEAKQEHINTLSEEYDAGKILTVAKW